MRLYGYMIISLLAVATWVVTACSDDYAGSLSSNGVGRPIKVGSVYPSHEMQTRIAIDGGFVADDVMGVFVVDRDADDGEGEVLLSGNRASNMKFTLQENGEWISPAQLYWDSKGRAADFYGYYPFVEQLNAVTDYSFSVVSHQDAEASSLSAAGYEASDLLWAKAENVQPTVETVMLQYQHLMAGVTIRLEKGTGFTAEEWAQLDKTVLIQNTVQSGKVDLTKGEVSVSSGGSVKNIMPLIHNGEWRAVVFPQSVAGGKTLVSVTIDGQNYALKKSETMTFLSGKMHTFTITVDRKSASGQFTFTLADEAITAWLDDADLHEGIVRQYLVVEVKAAGTLAETLQKMGKDAEQIENLKVVGNINRVDLDFMSSMPKLTNLNLQKALIDDGTLAGFRDSQLLHFVYPEKGVKKIASLTFAGSRLAGSVVIPEGVEEIGESVYQGCRGLSGTLSLPSTLKKTDRGLLAYVDGLYGEFQLPPNIEVWGGCDGGNFTGTCYFPASMHELNGKIPQGWTGTINWPQGMQICGLAFEGSQCTAVSIPEGVEEIPGGAFRSSEIRGELVLPSTLKKICSEAFYGTKISKVVFPDALRVMEDGMYNFSGLFADCSRLSGTLELPKNVTRIPKGCFMNCSMLSGIIISENTQVIDEEAFEMCENLNSIVCRAEEPPVVCKNAFLGVPKDNFTVEVPKGCVEKYKQARGWSEFKRIAEHSNFVCRPATACALNTVHSETLVLNADGAWRVEHKPDWCTLSRTSGTGKTELMVTFHSLPHGAEARSDSLLFAMETMDAKGNVSTVHTYCVLSQYDYEHEEDSYLTLQKASKGYRGGIDIVFVGDGYDGKSISDGTYLDLVRYQTECFFAVEPYKSMRNYFNVYVTFPLSQETGVNTMYTYVNNRFGTLQGESELEIGGGCCGSCISGALITESDEVMNYAVEKTPMTEEKRHEGVVILVPNSTDYEGNTLMNRDGSALSICPPSENPYPRDTRGMIQHEVGGHAFGKLGDEAISRNGFVPAKVKEEIEYMHGMGWYQNLTLTGKLSQVPWADFIFDTRYSDYVDVYEGGCGYTRGVYRPEANSCMNYGIPYYNTPSRLEIWKRIKENAGEPWSMEDFYAQDTFEWGETYLTRATRELVAGSGYAESNQHHVPQLVKFREVGDKVRSIRKNLKQKYLNK